jgi:hypothetical protein
MGHTGLKAKVEEVEDSHSSFQEELIKLHNNIQVYRTQVT